MARAITRFRTTRFPLGSSSVPGDIIECHLTSLEYGGDACAKYGTGLVFVPRGVPGDRVKVRIKRQRKNFSSADIVAMVSPSPHRVKPDCPFFLEGCGGCQWLHVDYPAQLLWKQRILSKSLTKALGVKVTPAPVVPMRDPTACRNKLSMVRHRNGQFGLMKENSKDLVPIDHCPMELPLIQRVFHQLSRVSFPPPVTQIHLRGTRHECGLTMYADQAPPSLTSFAKKLLQSHPSLSSAAVRTEAGTRLLAGLPFLSQRVGRLEFRIPPDAFFQINYFQAVTLLETVKNLLKVTRNETVVDLYAGVGFFSLELAREARSVVGIEGNPAAVDAARLNARLNRIDNALFRSCSTAQGLHSFQPGDVNALILDPPRAGCDTHTIRELVRLKIPRLAYVSCDPLTLSRDCALLIEGGYLLGDIRPVDMFPHTWHLETVVSLVSRK